MPILVGCFGSELDKSRCVCDLWKKVALVAPPVTYANFIARSPFREWQYLPKTLRIPRKAMKIKKCNCQITIHYDNETD